MFSLPFSLMKPSDKFGDYTQYLLHGSLTQLWLTIKKLIHIYYLLLVLLGDVWTRSNCYNIRWYCRFFPDRLLRTYAFYGYSSEYVYLFQMYLIVSFQEVCSVICYICSLSKWRVLSLRLLLCLNGPLSFCHQLDCLESTVLRPEKSTDITQRALAACILGHFRAITTAVRVAGLCGLFILQGTCPVLNKDLLS